MTPEEHDELSTLRALVRSHAEHAEKLVAEKAALVARIRALEAKPKSYDEWHREAYFAAYTAATEKLSEDVRAKFAENDRVIAAQERAINDLAFLRRRGEKRRRAHYARLVQNRERAKRLDRLYRKWRARAERAEAHARDRLAGWHSEIAVLRTEVLAARNNALEEAAQYVAVALDPPMSDWLAPAVRSLKEAK